MTSEHQTLSPWRIERRVVRAEGRSRRIFLVCRGYGGHAQYLRGPVNIGATGWWTEAEARAAIANAAGYFA